MNTQFKNLGFTVGAKDVARFITESATLTFFQLCWSQSRFRSYRYAAYYAA